MMCPYVYTHNTYGHIIEPWALGVSAYELLFDVNKKLPEAWRRPSRSQISHAISSLVKVSVAEAQITMINDRDGPLETLWLVCARV